jgi:hypothetical protein
VLYISKNKQLRDCVTASDACVYLSVWSVCLVVLVCACVFVCVCVCVVCVCGVCVCVCVCCVCVCVRFVCVLCNM